ncbi:hypothetical protein PIB30_096773 [Stylosanthes scabra]|uniref:Uncharacterized protein n=1 Tax=Stylosanthes scabra TaxID=79078 RepID=A0ABU6TVR8_9FABA|nr:hypothetical protein [Stylosanthes scabra]
MDELAAMKAKQEEFFSNQVNQYNMIRQDEKLLGKEILDVKKYQMSAVTMGSGGSSSSTQPPPPPPYEPDQALMKIRKQHATFTEICRQLKDWTRNASGRESYMVWAHQLANPNLVEMSSQKIVKQIYDNIDRKRPMFRGKMKKGSLQSKKQSLEAKQRKNSTHMGGRAHICVLLEDLSTPRQLWPRLGVAPWLHLTTHRRRSPRICMGSQQLTFQSHVKTSPNVTKTSTSLIHPRIGVQDPRICMEGSLAGSNHA